MLYIIVATDVMAKGKIGPSISSQTKWALKLVNNEDC